MSGQDTAPRSAREGSQEDSREGGGRGAGGGGMAKVAVIGAGAWGTALALAQDAVVASENAVLTLSGRKVAAERALRIGLVHDVVPAETLLRRAFEIAIALGARGQHGFEMSPRPPRAHLRNIQPTRTQQAGSNWG